MLLHGSILSDVGASTIPGAVQLAFESAEHDARQAWSDAQRIGVKAGDTESVILTAFNDCKDDLSVKRGAAAQAEMELATAHQRLVSVKEQFAQSGVVAARAKAIVDSAGLPENALKNWDLATQDRDAMHSSSPYMTEELFAAKREVFIAAMELHKAFIVAAWTKLARSLSAFVNVLNGSLAPSQIRDGMTQLWDAFFLVVPLVSTTFASLPRLFSGVKREELAWLLIDEAGQAAPQQAVGAIWRAKRIIIVGDPLQLEPVVSVPNEIIAALLKRCAAEAQWAPPAASAQTLADRANRFGMYLGEQDGDTAVWLGSPLLVHRRCINPMFKIANSIAYENKMVYGGGEDSGGVGIGLSRWFDMPATVAEGHWIEEQGCKALELVHQLTAGNLREQTGQFKVYVITPFKTVSEKMRGMLYAHYKDASKGMVGTVHTFQGKEAEHVIFLLGGNPKSPGVISSFAGAKPNLVNVAVTRAKRRLYVIGNHRYWTGAADVNQIFTRMAEHLEVERS